MQGTSLTTSIPRIHFIISDYEHSHNRIHFSRRHFYRWVIVLGECSRVLSALMVRQIPSKFEYFTVDDKGLFL